MPYTSEMTRSMLYYRITWTFDCANYVQDTYIIFTIAPRSGATIKGKVWGGVKFSDITVY